MRISSTSYTADQRGYVFAVSARYSDGAHELSVSINNVMVSKFYSVVRSTYSTSLFIVDVGDIVSYAVFGSEASYIEFIPCK